MPTSISIVMGSRGSHLARTQSQWVADRLMEAIPEADVLIEIIKTQGDVVLDKPLTQFNDKGLFTREIEEALLDGRIDCAVHSLKDLPTEMPKGLTIACIPEREDARDALIVRSHLEAGMEPVDAKELLDEMPEGAVVGTSSLRRKAQLLRLRSDLRIEDIRGNVDTRLQKLASGQYDAIILAAAGLRRIGREDAISAFFPYSMMLPAVGQGALAVQTRENDGETIRYVHSLENWADRQAVTAERAFLAAVGGGCQSPIACLAEVSGHNMELRAFLSEEDGSNSSRDRLNANASEPEWAGKKLARKMKPLF
jgi:hydroxymethylbilane synthase